MVNFLRPGDIVTGVTFVDGRVGIKIDETTTVSDLMVATAEKTGLQLKNIRPVVKIQNASIGVDFALKANQRILEIANLASANFCMVYRKATPRTCMHQEIVNNFKLFKLLELPVQSAGLPTYENYLKSERAKLEESIKKELNQQLDEYFTILTDPQNAAFESTCGKPSARLLSEIEFHNRSVELTQSNVAVSAPKVVKK